MSISSWNNASNRPVRPKDKCRFVFTERLKDKTPSNKAVLHASRVYVLSCNCKSGMRSFPCQFCRGKQTAFICVVPLKCLAELPVRKYQSLEWVKDQALTLVRES